MMCGYPFVGTLVKRFGNRAVSAGGAFLALTGTLPLVYRASHGLVIPILGFALFIPRHGSELCWRSFPFGCVFFRPPGRPAEATTALNIVMRIGGPTLTTVCATFLGWRLGLAQTPAALQGAFTAAFLLLCMFHAALFAAAMRLPQSVEGTNKQPHASASVTLESVSE
jgi:hypothetical protein